MGWRGARWHAAHLGCHEPGPGLRASTADSGSLRVLFIGTRGPRSTAGSGAGDPIFPGPHERPTFRSSIRAAYGCSVEKPEAPEEPGSGMASGI